jgi:hypothetical protein
LECATSALKTAIDGNVSPGWQGKPRVAFGHSLPVAAARERVFFLLADQNGLDGSKISRSGNIEVERRIGDRERLEK